VSGDAEYVSKRCNIEELARRKLWSFVTYSCVEEMGRMAFALGMRGCEILRSQWNLGGEVCEMWNSSMED